MPSRRNLQIPGFQQLNSLRPLNRVIQGKGILSFWIIGREGTLQKEGPRNSIQTLSENVSASICASARKEAVVPLVRPSQMSIPEC